MFIIYMHIQNDNVFTFIQIILLKHFNNVLLFSYYFFELTNYITLD
jgi:hypothetical protein